MSPRGAVFLGGAFLSASTIFFLVEGHANYLVDKRRRRFYCLCVFKDENDVVGYFDCIISDRQAGALVGDVNDVLVSAVASGHGVDFRRSQFCIYRAGQDVCRVGARAIQGYFSDNFDNTVCTSTKVDHVADCQASVGSVPISTFRRSKGRCAHRDRRNFCVDVGRGVPFIRISLGFFVRAGRGANVIRRCVGAFPLFQWEDRYRNHYVPVACVGQRRTSACSMFDFRFCFRLFGFYRIANVRGRVQALQDGLAHASFAGTATYSHCGGSFAFRFFLCGFELLVW